MFAAGKPVFRIVCLLLCGSACPLSLGAEETYTPGQAVNGNFQEFAQPFLKTYCYDCHGYGANEGNLSLDELGPVDETNALVWKSVWAQLALGEMPPDEGNEPQIVERLQMTDWVAGEMSRVMRYKGGFNIQLDPAKGNFISHDLLFGPLPEQIRLEPTSSPARLWRVTPLEHLTRLNELIYVEPAYDPEKPGLRTHGDWVPVHARGALLLSFGIDNIRRSSSEFGEFHASIKTTPSILSTARTAGLDNYPHLYTVNGAEAVQILNLANDILSYMAYGVSSFAEPEQITDGPRSDVPNGDRGSRGTPSYVVYSTKVLRPLTPVYDLMKEPGVSDDRLRAAVDYVFEAVTFRPPTKKESDAYLEIVQQSVQDLGKEDGVIPGLSAIFLHRDALFRPELAESGTPDRYGRVMLQDWELGLAVNHALKFIAPDDTLKKAILDGRMRTKADVKREVERMLADDSIRKPRILQFFRDYFDYDRAGYVCKDTKALRSSGLRVLRDEWYYTDMHSTTIDTDRLIEHVLREDKDVLKQLLTTDRFIASEHASQYFGEQLGSGDKAAKAKSTEKGQVKPATLEGPEVFVRISRSNKHKGSMSSKRILGTVPEGQRLGILTHPSWLVSHSDAMDNHAIKRGHWIRERLLGGGIPDVPITVDAMLPDEPDHTLRERMRVTKEDYCWTCHQKMDPLGLPFEMYNHVGLFRTTELGKPVLTAGEIIDSGDPELDGPVTNAIDMIQKIADSERVEQVFVRHAFRFWMGRNETLNDAPVLQEAHQAYKKSGGSMNALIVSLVTSDAFLYRKVDR